MISKYDTNSTRTGLYERPEKLVSIYDSPGYRTNLYGPTYKIDGLDLWPSDASALDTDFADMFGVQTGQFGDADDPYPFGYAMFAGSAYYGSGIPVMLVDRMHCVPACSCQCHGPLY